jgi:predicted dehydrogenase
MEKPITQTLGEADELLAVAKQAGLKIAVAHQMRLAPNILWLKQSIGDGLIGELLEVNAHGKQDQRAGGEDLIVLGVHLFDLMRFFAGDPLWCAACALQSGHEIALRDAHAATEDIGPVAGDEIVAQFAFPKGVHATFTSRARNREVAGPWGMELVGTKSRFKIQMDMVPKIYALNRGNWTAGGQRSDWLPLEKDPARDLPESQKSVVRANQRVADDWLDAIARNHDPICSGYAASKALEMAMAVFAAGLSRGRVELPLPNRNHPLHPATSK